MTEKRHYFQSLFESVANKFRRIAAESIKAKAIRLNQENSKFSSTEQPSRLLRKPINVPLCFVRINPSEIFETISPEKYAIFVICIEIKIIFFLFKSKKKTRRREAKLFYRFYFIFHVLKKSTRFHHCSQFANDVFEY